MGKRKKKDRDKEITNLTNTIARLEVLHKQSLALQVEEELTQCRNTLKQILNLKTQKSLFFRNSIFYEHGDKSGKKLARALKDATTANHIHAIHNKDGTLEHNSKKIVEIFHEFYYKLYNFPPQHKPPHLTLQ